MRVYNGIVQPLIGSERINTKIDKIFENSKFLEIESKFRESDKKRKYEGWICKSEIFHGKRIGSCIVIRKNVIQRCRGR